MPTYSSPFSEESVTFTSPFTGTVVTPTDVSYYALNFDTDTQLYWPTVVNPTQVPAARIMDCVASTSSLSILLPNALQGAVGTDVLIRNKGSNTFYVTDADGGASVAVGAGISLYFYLSDNTSVAGVWQNVTFGAGTSSADAATLAGAGLAAIGGQLAVTNEPYVSSSAPTINDASRAKTYIWTGGNGTYTLPDTATLSSGWWIGFRNNGTGTLALATTGGALVNDTTNVTANPGNSGFIFFQKSTGEFYTMGLQTPTNVTFTSAVYDVDNIVGADLSLVTFAPIIQTYVSLSGTRTTPLNVILPATTALYILVNDTTTILYDITFTVSGAPSPALTLAPGSIVTVLCDGNTLIILSQNSSTYFYGADGAASLPTFSFLSDTTTGMYLSSSGVLGLTANATEMMLLDNSVPSNPQISTPASFTASGTITALNGVLGGTF